MKIIYYFCVFCLLMACGQKVEKSQPDTVNEVPQQWLTFDGKDKNAKHIVLVSGDEEYRSEEALPQLAKILSKHHGFKCTVLFAQNPERPGIVDANYVNNIPGLEALQSADLMVIFTRFRALPDDQMRYIDDYLKSGKPVVGIRTATHAFNFEGDSLTHFNHYSNNYSGDIKEWTDGFGRLVLGEKWISHHGHHKHQSTKGIIAKDAESHPLANGIMAGDIWGATDVYGVRLPLPGDSRPIIMGQVINRKAEFEQGDLFYGMRQTDNEIADKNEDGEALNNPMMPIAWTKTYQLPYGEKGTAFTSTLGASSDLMNEGVRRLLVNGIFWSMGLEVPLKTDVTLVGTYHPTAFEFREDNYWIQKNMKISDLD